MIRIKICCISSVEEARMAVVLGASALGLVSAMPSGPGVIDEALIAEIAASVPPPIATFLLTSRTNAEGIIEQQYRCAVNTIQICDRVAPQTLQELRCALPGISLVQVIHVRDESSIDEALAMSPYVDALLLDSGNQTLAIKELGGTGRTHDWSLSARLVEAVSVPVFLAGGLNAGNVAEAIRTVKPFGIDVCSGVRQDGKLHAEKLEAFMHEALSKP